MRRARKMMREMIGMAAVLACSLGAAPAAAQEEGAEAEDAELVAPDDQPPPTAETAERPVSDVAIELLRRVHLVNRFEMEAGRLAMQKGERARVRRLGERIMRDHRVADRQVRQLAGSLDVSLPGSDFDAMAERSTDELTATEQQMTELLDRLEQAKGADFDRTYAQSMRLSHRAAIDYVSSTRLDVEMSSVRTVAGDLLPILRQHQELAASVQHDLEEAAEAES